MTVIVNHDYPTERLRAERDAGAFICQCTWAEPVRWALYDIVECNRCHRKVMP